MAQLTDLLRADQIISVINKMLVYVDPHLVDHGKRVAYIAQEILNQIDDGGAEIDRQSLFVLSILHDIGAYKTGEIDELLTFNSKQVFRHSIYGYLFLKNMSPVGPLAEAILYHHLDYKDYNQVKSDALAYAGLIHLADQIDIAVLLGLEGNRFEIIEEDKEAHFCPAYVDAFRRAGPARIEQSLLSGSWRKEVEASLFALNLSAEQAFAYLRMMVFSIDFRSEATVPHTISTTAISIELGKRLHLSEQELQLLYLGAFLHDVGKIAIPNEILESQGQLTFEEMQVMKLHVSFTREIVEGLVDERVCRIASRHHEKVNGGGYPDGLTGENLTLPEKIVAVADIASALAGRRSYKEAFSKAKTIGILTQMEKDGLLYAPVCNVLISSFDEVMQAAAAGSAPVIALYKEMHAQYFTLSQKAQSFLRAGS